MAEDENMPRLKGKRLCIMAIVAFLLIVPVQPIITMSDGNTHTSLATLEGDDDLSNPSTAGDPMTGQENDGNEYQTDSPMQLGREGYVKVIVATSNIGELGKFLECHNYRGGLIGRESSEGMAFPILEIPIPLISKIEQLDFVIGVYPYQTPIREDSISNHQPADLASGIGSVQPLGIGTYSGENIRVAVVDTGVDFGHPALSDKYAVAPDVDFVITDEMVIEESDGNVTQAMLVYGDITPSSYVIKVNGTALTETTHYTIDLTSGLITFANTGVAPLNSVVTASYSCHSPYAGWPIAFDSASMKTYVDSEAKPGGWYVNMSYNGTDQFEDVHVITVDGVKDFGDVELIAEDYTADFLDMGTNPADYNVDDLYVTRDLENLYFGFTTFTGVPSSNVSEVLAYANMSYGIYIDVDGPGGGGDYDPRGNYIDTKASHANSVNAVAYSPDGSMIASASGGRNVGTFYKDTSIKIWNANTGLLLTTLKGHTADKAPMSLAWADNNILASADNSYIYFWNVNTGQQIGNRIDYSAQGHPLGVTEPHSIISINSNGTFIAVGGQGSATEGIGLYDVATRTYIKSYSITGGTDAYSVAFSPDGALIAAALSDKTVVTFDVVTGTKVVYNGHTDYVFSVAWNSDGSRFVTGSRDKTIKIWDLGVPAAAMTFTSNYTNELAWSPDDSKLVAATSYTEEKHNNVEIWDVSNNVAPLKQFNIPDEVYSVDWFLDSIVSGSRDTKVRTWDVSGAASGWGLTNIFRGYLPDYAIYLDHVGAEWGVDSEGDIWHANDSFNYWMLYEWDETDTEWKEVFGVYNATVGIDTRTDPNAWLLANNTLLKDGRYYEIPLNNTISYGGSLVKLLNTTGRLSYSGFLDYASSGFLEIGFDRDLIDNPWTMNFTMFTTNDEKSHAQDIVPSDPNVEFTIPDFGTTNTSLAAFAQYTPDILYVQLDAANSSTSGKYYTGNHPDQNFIAKLGSVGMLLVDSQTSGVYDKLYIDGNHDKIYEDNDPCINMSNPARQFHYVHHIGDDTFHYNYSTGLLYFIADGRNPIPYSDVYADRYGVLRQNFTRNYIPKNGELICMMGEFSLGTVHGTKTASAITTRAEDASIIAIGDVTEGNFFDSVYFAAEGYDGKIGTDDDAHLVSIGVNYPDQNNEMDIYAKFTDWISTIYTPDDLACIASVGNDGFGYGSVLSPATGANTIAVGSASDYGFFETAANGPNKHRGDVSLASSRGPTFTGLPKPDVMNYGVFNVSLPLIQPDGANNYTIWEGSDAASAVTAGDLALIYDAYYNVTHFIENEVVVHATMNMTKVSLRHYPVVSCTIRKNGDVTSAYTIDQANGVITFDDNIVSGDWISASYTFTHDYPDVTTARSLLKSAADDMLNDVLTQGAGIVNLTRSVGMANGSMGLAVTPSSWIPGDFKGESYDCFVNTMLPGETDAVEFTLTNPGSGTITARITDSKFQKICEYTYSHQTTSQSDERYVVVNGTGIYEVVGAGGSAQLQKIMAIDQSLWFTAQMMQVNAYADWNLLYDHEYGDILHNYGCGIFDWTFNASNPIVDALNLNQMSCSMCAGESSNVLEARIFDPARRTHDGAVVKLKHNPVPNEGAQNVTWRITVSFYNRTDWAWLSLDSSTASVVSTASSNTGNFGATVVVPNDASMGSYEGAIRLTYDDVNVVNEQVLTAALEGTTATQLANMDIIGITELRLNSVAQSSSTYTLDKQSGTVIIDTPLSSGDSITVDYSYSASSIVIPVLVNVEPPIPRCSFGGSTVINVTNELVTDVVTNMETEWLFEVKKNHCVETIPVPTYTVTNEPLANNANTSVYGELLNVYWDNGETAYLAWFSHSWEAHSADGLDYATADDPGYPVNIYNGTTLLTEGVDYTLYKGDVNNGGGRVTFLSTVDLNDTFIADYTYFRCNWDEVIWARENTDEVVNGSSIELFWKDGTEITSGWSWDGSSEKFTFTQPIPAGEVITVDYTYYTKIQFHTLKFDTARNENTTYISSSCVFIKNGGLMIKDLDYSILVDGRIKFLGSAILKQGDVVVVNYDYYYLYGNWPLGRGHVFDETIVNGSYSISNNSHPYRADKYELDCKNGNITFNMYPLPGDNLTITYRYYNTSLYTRTDANVEDSPLGFNYGILDHSNIIGGSQQVYKKSGVTWTLLTEFEDYTMDLAHGKIMYNTAITPTDEIMATYAYSDTLAVPYNPNGIFGGDDHRFYYINIPDQGLNRNLNGLLRIAVDVKWDHKPSDVDIAIWGEATRRPTIPGTDEKNFPSSRYGDTTVEELGRTSFSPTFLTATNDSNELLITTLKPGLNVIEINGAMLNGTLPYETISADVGILYVSEESIAVYTQNLSGKAPITLVSSLAWSGVNVSALGPAVGKMYLNEEVYPNDPAWGNYKSFQEQLAIGQLEDEPLYTLAVDVRNAATFEVHIWGHDDCPDLDLGVFLDENEDGITQTEEFVDYGADADADEEVLVVSPEDGTYLIRVFGFTLTTTPGHFDMKVSMILSGVEGYGVEGLGEDIEPMIGVFKVNNTIPAYTLQTYNMTWNFPGDTADDEFGGVVYIGPSNAPEVLSIVAKIIIDRKEPVINDTTRPSNRAIINNNRPVISAGIEDVVREEIDRKSIKLYVDGADVTSIARVSVPLIADSTGSGYPQGTVTYKPNNHLSEGGHSVVLKATDWAGNEATKEWSFTVDTIKPELTLTSVSDLTYTNQFTIKVQGRSEMAAEVGVMVGAVTAEVKRDAVGGFSADIGLEEGENRIMVNATDDAGNEEIKVITVYVDTEIPSYERLVCVDGTLTNAANTALTGSISEIGTMKVNGDPTSVNSDGSFYEFVELSEGENVFAFEFTDMAGNTAYEWLNVTLDVQPPVINLDHIDSKVTTDSVNITGTTEVGSYVSINGKLVLVEGTRQQTGSFAKVVRLSPGSNTLVVEARDAAGNSETVFITVTYEEETGTNYAAIGVMVLLLIVGLIIGLLFAGLLFGRAPPEEEDLEKAPEEDLEEGAPEGEEPGEELEKEPGEDLEEGAPEGEEPGEELEKEPGEDLEEEAAEGEEPEEGEGLEAEEDIEPSEEVSAEPETEIEDADAEMEEPAEEIEAEPKEETPPEEPSIDEDDPRVMKLKEAYESGKISKALYEKNLAKFRK
jgi:WD40 repeat protein